MYKLILLIIFLTYDSYCYCQLTFTKMRDTSWYVELKDSTVLYSKKLRVRYSEKDGEYLLLDHHQKILMSEVLRYRSRTGEYVREKGPVETYRIEKGGPRLFVYSRSFTYSDSNGFHTGHDYFLRKGLTGDMQKMSYRNLKEAMADNLASMRQLQASRTTVLIAGGAGAVGFLFTLIGGAQSFKQHSRVNQSMPTPPTFPVRPGPPMPPAQPDRSSVSPLLIVGPVIMIGAIITMCTAPGHVHKAINIYNQ
ncbi:MULTISPECIES: hypothetical protein [Niastella]|uniref:DUF4178 domain-containing protein n=1 Tax=Niastella soli TaxID=2821487 RepID=A0ABS3YY99_9BACT|nr:hypothetical protein [Niastella soli]MBO9202390.1 hypothetical protein [Niastella soli]